MFYKYKLVFKALILLKEPFCFEIQRNVLPGLVEKAGQRFNVKAWSKFCTDFFNP